MVARRRVRRTVRRRRVVRRHGRGFLDALKSAHNWVKQNKIISTVGNALGSVLPVATIGKAADALGYGRRRRVRRRVGRRRQRGRGLADVLGKVHGFVKSNQLVSKGLAHFNHPKLAGVAQSLGYGRRRRRARGGAGYGSFFTTSQIARPQW